MLRFLGKNFANNVPLRRTKRRAINSQSSKKIFEFGLHL